MAAVYFRLYVDGRPKGKRAISWIKVARYAEKLGLGKVTEKGFKSTTAVEVEIRKVGMMEK